MLYTVIVLAGMVLAGIVAAFVIELLVVALFPNVSAPRQHLTKGREPLLEGLVHSDRRWDVTFEVEGISISAWLYLPRGQSSPVPCIVMAHGLGGTKKMLEQYATRFQDAGMAVLLFDYRYLGESNGEPRQLIWIPYQLQDYAAAVAYARSLKEVNAERIGLWGTSLSGGHVLVTAARDSGIACVSAQCPLLDGLAASEQQLHRLGIKYALRMLGHAQRDLVRSWLGLSPHKIPIVGRTGSLALMSDDDAWDFFAQYAPDDFVNEACARIAIRIDKYRPIEQVHKISRPVLLQTCDHDFALPSTVVDRAASRLGGLAQIVRYPIGHFDIYRGSHFETAVSRQIEFFSKHLFLTDSK